jgi:sRNA-binding protein
MNSKAAIAHLAVAAPKAFFTDPARRRPLKIGIADDIASKLDGAIRPQDLRRALGCYANSPGYLRSCVEGAPRFDLAGNEAGTVTADEAEHARQKLDAVLAKRQPKPLALAAQQRHEGPAAQERPPRKQQPANLDHGEVGPQRCKTTSLARPCSDAAGRRETGAREQPAPAPDAPARMGFAELRASAAARRRERSVERQ